MRQVEKECNELDWSQKEGKNIGGGVATIADDLNGRDSAGAPGIRLGGGSGTSRLLQMKSALSNEERQHDDVEMEEPHEGEREEKREEVETEAPDEIMQTSTEQLEPSLASNDNNTEDQTHTIESIAIAPTPSVGTVVIIS